MHLAQHQSLAGGSISNHMHNRAPGRGAVSGSTSLNIGFRSKNLSPGVSELYSEG
ncbi:MAG: hypothetical protein XD72_2218 [Methanothrix harundinacea]|uniref:Uncharacterized protein n=1 Tax=Methanothrix harundinacea TaxID=301375 RepID=A0A101FS33_9EURY|nr:MAG: hypothetical protein XD72_2218 [Methanothrix harundinacea]